MGNSTVIAGGLVGPDDFEVDEHSGTAYLANGVANQFLAIDLKDGTTEVLASVPGPTSVRWARLPRKGHEETDRELYLSTVGGLQQYIGGNITLGGAVYKANVGR